MVETPTANAQEWNYNIRSWQSQDGLPEETVQAFAQTPDGYLWVGTSGGLIRFDGARFPACLTMRTPLPLKGTAFSACWLGAMAGFGSAQTVAD